MRSRNAVRSAGLRNAGFRLPFGPETSQAPPHMLVTFNPVMVPRYVFAKYGIVSGP